MHSPGELYKQKIQSGEISADVFQQQAFASIDRFFFDCQQRQNSQSFSLKSFFSSSVKKPVRGLYLWGGVGRGKTWMMDLLYESMNADDCFRQHYHAFMQETHEAMRKHTGRKDPLQSVAEQMAKKYHALFLDEFHVVDIADAIILAQLLKGLFSNGIALVTTSNVVPENLYKAGVQRASFLPAIALLEQHTEVINVGGSHDYRSAILEKSAVYFSVSDTQSAAQFTQEFSLLTREQEIKDKECLTIASRQICYVKQGLDVVWFTFDQLCNSPRHSSDYLEIANRFDTVFIDELPALDSTMDDAVRRFIGMVDIFYDHHVKVVIRAQTSLDKLYSGERLAFEFNRTISRLREMQSHAYLSQVHRPGGMGNE